MTKRVRYTGAPGVWRPLELQVPGEPIGMEPGAEYECSDELAKALAEREDFELAGGTTAKGGKA